MVHNQPRSWPHAQARESTIAQNLPQADMKCHDMTELEGALGDHGSASGSLFDSGSVSRISGKRRLVDGKGWAFFDSRWGW